MPLITNGEKARQIIHAYSESGQSLPCFCTESVYTTEAIFRGVNSFMETAQLATPLPVIIAFTASYSDRQQLKNYTGLSDPGEGLLALRNDIERLSRAGGPYPNLDVIVHLDHAQPGEDDWIIEEYSDFVSSVMWDCSHYSLQENIRMTAAFVSKYSSSFVIEGAVDEIYNYDSHNIRGGVIDRITDPDAAARYYHETGCDLIVANLGTEHRRTQGTVEYRGDVARAISGKIGRKLTLHGTSSIQSNALSCLPGDGIVKVNMWGRLESDPGKKLVETLLREITGQLSPERAKTLMEQGILGKAYANKDFSPSIQFLTEKYRRDSIYLPEAESIVTDVCRQLYLPRKA